MCVVYSGGERSDAWEKGKDIVIEGERSEGRACQGALLHFIMEMYRSFVRTGQS